MGDPLGDPFRYPHIPKAGLGELELFRLHCFNELRKVAEEGARDMTGVMHTAYLGHWAFV